MGTKTTEWKRVKLSNEILDFSGAQHASLENDGDSLISVTFKLKSGKTVRIRKADYSVLIEEPLIPTITKYIAKTSTGLLSEFNSEHEAEQALGEIPGSIEKISVPIEQNQLENCPF